MGNEHVYRFVNEACPAIPSGVVRDLLIYKTDYQCGPYVGMALFGDSVEGEQFTNARQRTHRRCVRLGRRFEAGERTLEQQLIPRWGTCAEQRKPVCNRHEHFAWVAVVVRLGHFYFELGCGPAEH